MDRVVEADYLVIGAGVMGMAFIDALIDHAEGHVALVDRLQAAGGHWLAARPSVRLHQTSASTASPRPCSGNGSIQEEGPRRGRRAADQPTPAPTTHDAPTSRRLASERVEFFAGTRTSAAAPSSRSSWGDRFEVPETCRTQDARYIAPGDTVADAPAFGVAMTLRLRPERPPWGRRVTGPVRRRGTCKMGPTRSSGRWGVGWTPTRSAGSGLVIPGCSTER